MIMPRKLNTNTTEHSLAKLLAHEGIKTFGKASILDAQETMDSIYGVPLKELVLQYLFGLDVMALSKVFSIVGPPGSMKSLFSWELGRKIIDPNGVIIFLDMEYKFNAPHVLGLFENPAVWGNRVTHVNPTNLDELLRAIAFYFNKYLELAPIKDIPMWILVDSLAMALTEEEMTSLVKDNKASDAKGYQAAHRALEISRQIQGMQARLLLAPVNLVLINHQHKTMEDGGNRPSYLGPIYQEPGGVLKDYAYAYLFELQKGREISVAGETRRQILIKTKKSSFGPDNRRIMITVKTWQDVQEKRLRVKWDWNTALIDLLMGDELGKNEIKEILHITKEGQAYTCPELKLEKVSADVVGETIQNTPSIVEGLQNVMRIVRAKKFTAGETESISLTDGTG
jgi:hypothetical protein